MPRDEFVVVYDAQRKEILKSCTDDLQKRNFPCHSTMTSRHISDFEDIAKLIPLMAKIYPNGLADVNHFHAAGGLSFMINELFI